MYKPKALWKYACMVGIALSAGSCPNREVMSNQDLFQIWEKQETNIRLYESPEDPILLEVTPKEGSGIEDMIPDSSGTQ
ncbi:MAG: hypothetical protein ABH879_00060 [archaeon]